MRQSSRKDFTTKRTTTTPILYYKTCKCHTGYCPIWDPCNVWYRVYRMQVEWILCVQPPKLLWDGFNVYINPRTRPSVRQEIIHHCPSSLIIVNHRPHRPSSSIIVHHCASSHIIAHHRPSSSIIIYQHPSSSDIVHHRPSSPSIIIRHYIIRHHPSSSIIITTKAVVPCLILKRFCQTFSNWSASQYNLKALSGCNHNCKLAVASSDIRQASCVIRLASCFMRRAPCDVRHASCVMRHACSVRSYQNR